MANAHTHVQRLVSVVKMAIVLEGRTTEDQHSVVRFCGQKDSMQRIFINKYYLFTAGSVCLVSPLTTTSKNCHLGCKCVADDEKVKAEVRNFKKIIMLRVSTHW
jgi:hypothetical protein